MLCTHTDMQIHTWIRTRICRRIHRYANRYTNRYARICTDTRTDTRIWKMSTHRYSHEYATFAHNYARIRGVNVRKDPVTPAIPPGRHRPHTLKFYEWIPIAKIGCVAGYLCRDLCIHARSFVLHVAGSSQ